jgi:hypothetical protein
MEKHKVNGVYVPIQAATGRVVFMTQPWFLPLLHPYRKLVKKSHMTHMEHLGRISKIVI